MILMGTYVRDVRTGARGHVIGWENNFMGRVYRIKLDEAVAGSHIAHVREQHLERVS